LNEESRRQRGVSLVSASNSERRSREPDQAERRAKRGACPDRLHVVQIPAPPRLLRASREEQRVNGGV
jgi:hypothetical protein